MRAVRRGPLAAGVSAVGACTGGYDFGPYDLHAADELLHDLGLPSRRTGNVLAEYLLPGVAHRYRGLTAESRSA
ncbi:hypothetical protein IOD16_17055 [Saccharothrix sp. 6-C]|uniref:hypothetical protein n=1 Tax=Saccharothrix sp. 6-C TaxID=2781735 RepID=UPI001917243C|nr:hypothetical protein [Saccharothrix sp. 6-C]QQQ79944.1 hypothetical protein IOD16_17055 [Saccharothrix sp. 6-C]